MEKYNGISFDLWMTLIKSHKNFKSAREEMVFKYFNPDRKSLDWIKSAIRSSDTYTTEMSEKSGLHIPASTIWARVFRILNTPITIEKILDVDDRTQKLFKKYPPVPYDSNTIPTLKKLVKRHKLYVSSNTGFIKGLTIIESIDSEILELISEWKFSDECHFSKPHPEMFFKNVIMHVGDNPTADGGSVKVNVDFFQINSNSKTILDLL